MKIKYGITRIVFVFDNFVIKIPNFKCYHLHFLQGCYSNWSERNFNKTFKNTEFIDLVVPSLFCTWFGLVQIQRKVEILDRELTDAEMKKFETVCSGDFKPPNFGFYNNNLVCIDYP